jgi:1,2-diacylglycerol-3-alpha-glucose alpha-1,2-galactosyltransferase
MDRHITHFSESVWSVQGHGVHTAFEDTVRALHARGLGVGVNDWHRHGILHAHTVGPVVVLRTLVHRGPRVISAHVTDMSIVGSIRWARCLRPAFAVYLRWVYGLFDSVICGSDESLGEVIALGVRQPLEKIPNIVWPESLRVNHQANGSSARDSLGLPTDRPVFLCVGQLQPRKNVGLFIEVAKAVPEAHFAWVGGILFGPASAGRAEIRTLIANAPQNAHFYGQRSRREVGAFLHAADAFFFPSSHETFGMAVMEAACAGLPLVLNDLAIYDETLARQQIPYLRATDSAGHVKNVRALMADLRNTIQPPAGSQLTPRSHGAGRDRAEFAATRLATHYASFTADGSS